MTGQNDARTERMNEREMREYISALVDRDAAGLTAEEQATLQQLVDANPEYFGEYHSQLSTKLCLLKHRPSERCPKETAEGIRRLLTHVYQSRLASL